MRLNKPEVIVSVTLLIYSSKEIETLLIAEAFKIFFVSEYSFLEPHGSSLLEPSLNLIVPILLIKNGINCVHLSIPNNIRVDIIIVKMLLINSFHFLASFWDIVDLMLYPALTF